MSSSGWWKSVQAYCKDLSESSKAKSRTKRVSSREITGNAEQDESNIVNEPLPYPFPEVNYIAQ